MASVPAGTPANAGAVGMCVARTALCAGWCLRSVRLPGARAEMQGDPPHRAEDQIRKEMPLGERGRNVSGAEQQFAALPWSVARGLRCVHGCCGEGLPARFTSYCISVL